MAVSMRRVLVLCMLCLMSLAALYPLFSAAPWYDSHERDSYLYWLQEFKGIFESGVWYPRWASRLLGGYGYPSFVFYQPGVFFFILPFLYLPLSFTASLTLAIFCIFLISALGAYKLARFFGADRFVSILCSSIYLFMPYTYVDLYIRGDLSEFFALMLYPWVMVSIFRIRQEMPGPVRWQSLAFYVLFLTGVFFSHPHMSLFLILIIAWFALVDWIGDGIGSKSPWLLVMGGLMAAVLAAPYWFTLLQLASNVTLDNASRAVHQGMSWGELFYRTDAESYPWWPPTLGMLSLFNVGLALIGLILVFPGRLFWLVLPPLLVSVYMNTNQALPIWHAIPGSGFIQFAWRITAVSGLLQYIAIVQLGRARKKWRKGDYYTGALLIVLIGAFCQPSVEFDKANNHFVLRAFSYNRYLVILNKIPSGHFLKPFKSIDKNFADTNEFDPVWLDRASLLGCYPRHDDEPVMGSDPALSVHVEKAFLPYRIHGTVDIGTDAFKASSKTLDELPSVTINQIYFPGWAGFIDQKRLKIDGPLQESPVARMDAYGRIQVFFPHPGHYELESYYEGPPYWQVRNLVMGVLLLALMYGCRKFRLVK